MKMHFLSGGRLRMRKSVYFPSAEKGETFELPVICTLLKHEQGNVLFDTGCSPDAAENGEERWGGMVKVMNPIFRPEDAVTGQLDKAGLTPDDIDVVICSHLHADHCGCNAHFRKATIIAHAAEVAAATAENGPAMGYLPVEWDQPQGFDAFEGQRDLFGDGRIILLPVPGHTPGMTSALVTLDEAGEFLIASDAIAVEANLTEGYAPKNSWDLEKANIAIEELRKIGERGAQIIFGHDDAQWNRLRKGADFYA
ncbi:N-acyl homoserine lactonase family protein [Novosphingobium malaysiense]|uniref:Beta-lactamase n=1 Tax=Novosphingobium malaysiense TaxID=1348853 RepID=A0A0B1ZLV0_9SPHN|nr:N-acyl homoserine lactonase family protein [Novosphingobium malaysiense]KHK90319.1 beta-lactamase [Novosphingobium malaysiense]